MCAGYSFLAEFCPGIRSYYFTGSLPCWELTLDSSVKEQVSNKSDNAKETSENGRDKLNEKWSANQHQPPC
jgi:hypothetical protein